MTVTMILHGMFVFIDDGKQIEILLPYVDMHKGFIRVPFQPATQLDASKPATYTLNGPKAGQDTIVRPDLHLLCVKHFQRDEGAKRFATITVPRPRLAGILTGTDMVNPFEIPDKTNIVNPDMKRFADMFILEFDSSDSPILQGGDGSNIQLPAGVVTITSGPDHEMNEPQHRKDAVIAAVKHLKGLNVKWDGLLPSDVRHDKPAILFIQPPGCSPSFGDSL